MFQEGRVGKGMFLPPAVEQFKEVEAIESFRRKYWIMGCSASASLVGGALFNLYLIGQIRFGTWRLLIHPAQIADSSSACSPRI